MMGLLINNTQAWKPERLLYHKSTNVMKTMNNIEAHKDIDVHNHSMRKRKHDDYADT